MFRGYRVLRLGDVTYLVGTILIGVAGAMATAGLAGLALRDGSALPLLISAALTAAAGAVARHLTKVPNGLSFQRPLPP